MKAHALWGSLFVVGALLENDFLPCACTSHLNAQLVVSEELAVRQRPCLIPSLVGGGGGEWCGGGGRGSGGEW